MIALTKLLPFRPHSQDTRAISAEGKTPSACSPSSLVAPYRFTGLVGASSGYPFSQHPGQLVPPKTHQSVE